MRYGSTDRSMMWGFVFTMTLVVAVAVTAIVWVALAHSTEAERQWIIDNTCPPESGRPIIRYPAYLGGSHRAVCNPTGIVWRG